MLSFQRHEISKLLFSVSLLSAVLPLLLLHFANLWTNRPHYEFFPILIIGTLLLAWSRTPPVRLAEQNVWSRLASWLLLFAGLFVLAAATLLFSPWLGAIAAILTIGGVAIVWTGVEGIRQLHAVWLLLWMVVPPPFRLDDTLIYTLQGWTARGGSWLSEVASVPHLLMGNVIRLPGRELFVAEACSGVNSQLVLISAAAFITVILHRSPIHAAVLICSAVGWSVVANILRVTLVVVVAHHLDVDLSAGLFHEILGITMALLGLGLMLSTDQLMAAALGPIYGTAKDNEYASDMLSRCWNKFVASHEWEHIPLSDLEQDAPDDTEQASTDVEPSVRLQKIQTVCGFLLSGAFVSVATLAIICSVMTAPVNHLETFDLAQVTHRDWLPKQYQDWQFVKYRKQERESSSDEGQYSQTWDYASELGSCQVSVDYPFVGWHELSRCYRAHGWTVSDRTVRYERDRQGKRWPLVELEMQKPTGVAARLLFALVDISGQPVIPRTTHWSGLRGKLASSPLLGLLRGKNTRSVKTAIQLQLLVVSGTPSDAEQQRAFYRQVRSRFHGHWFAQTRQLAGS
ncbi:MAG: exosortase U [Planctomycetota bacterium]|nr:exosortase U [Planctomycetota bacterium]